MGIDEKCFLSGQSYVAVLNDSKGSRVLEVTEGREASAERLFESLGLEQRQKVEAVVMDMSAAFEAAAEAKMPQAEIVTTASMSPKILTKRSIRYGERSTAISRSKEKRP